MEKKDLMVSDTKQWALTLADSLAGIADKRQSLQMSSYMKDLFPFYGVPSEKRKAALKKHYEVHGLPDVKHAAHMINELWSKPERELHYCAQETFVKIKAHRQVESLPTIEMMIVNHSWWDSVDYIASTIAGEYMKLHDPDFKVIKRWNQSGNMWLIRSSLLFQLKYKDKMNMTLLEELIIPHKASKEFFIKKAIGWALRQASKHHPDTVREILKRQSLQPLSVKEASKYL